MKKKTKVRRMFVLNGGSFIYETGMMKFGMDMDKRQRICTPFYAFDTEEGWVLYDTGWSPSVLPLLVQLGMAPEIGEENNAVNQLKKSVSLLQISHQLSYPIYTPTMLEVCHFFQMRPCMSRRMNICMRFTQIPFSLWPIFKTPITPLILNGKFWKAIKILSQA